MKTILSYISGYWSIDSNSDCFQMNLIAIVGLTTSYHNTFRISRKKIKLNKTKQKSVDCGYFHQSHHPNRCGRYCRERGQHVIKYKCAVFGHSLHSQQHTHTHTQWYNQIVQQITNNCNQFKVKVSSIVVRQSRSLSMYLASKNIVVELKWMPRSAQDRLKWTEQPPTSNTIMHTI